MSKALEENGGGVSQQQRTGPLVKARLEPRATGGRRSYPDTQNGGGGVQSKSAAGGSSSRAASAASTSGGARSLRESGRNGDVKSSSGNASLSFQGERKVRDKGKSGDVVQQQQQPKSPCLGNASPAFLEVRGSRESRRNGEEQQQLQQPKCPSVDSSPRFQWEGSLRDSGRRSGDGQQLKSPSVSASHSSQCERSLRESRRSGDLQQPASPSGNPCSLSFHGERSLTDKSRNGDVQLPQFPSGEASPSSRAELSFEGGGRIANSHSVEPSPVIPEEKSSGGRGLRDSPGSGNVELPRIATPSGEGSSRDKSRNGDEQQQQQARSPSIQASPSFQRVRNLRDSIRSGDVPPAKSPSLASSSRAKLAAAFSPSIPKSASLGEGVTSAHFDSGSTVPPSRAATAPTTPPSVCFPPLKSKLAAGHKLYGAILVSFSTVVAEILGWAGYDFVVVDFEQLFPGDTFAALPVLQALATTGTPAIFRLRGDDPVLVNKALDMGAAGLMFSMIGSEEAARNAVASCRYPPRGTRRGSRHVVSRASRYGLDFSYMDRCEEELLVVCQVETTEALDHIMDIAGVDGVDCIQMGGLYFGDSLGDPYLDYNKEKILSRQKNVLLAGFATPESSSDSLFNRGYHLVSGAVDVVLLRNAAVADLKRNKPSVNA